MNTQVIAICTSVSKNNNGQQQQWPTSTQSNLCRAGENEKQEKGQLSTSSVKLPSPALRVPSHFCKNTEFR
jgi:hypothetical protein